MDVTGLPPGVEAAWGLRGRPAKGPRPGLSRDRIVAAAIAVADADGLAAVSMNRLAKELGTAPMSLYRHITGKDELLALMVDGASGTPPAVEPGTDWRAGLAHWAREMLTAVCRHPWMLHVPVSGPPVLPNGIAWMEEALKALDGTGLAAWERLSTLMLLSGYVRSQAVLEVQLDEAFRTTGTASDEALRGYAGLLLRLVDPQRFPAVTRLLSTDIFDRAGGLNDDFAFGLDRILDGVDALVRARA